MAEHEGNMENFSACKMSDLANMMQLGSDFFEPTLGCLRRLPL